MHEIKLHPYKADVGGFQALKLGTKDSYGIEQLHIVPGAAWNGLVVTATFVTGSTRVRVVVPEGGIIDVPQEATASAGGNIVFSGVSDGVQRITVDLPYTVSEHSPIDGTDPAPTPSEWEQFVAMVQQYAQQAGQSATEAAGSVTAAAYSSSEAAASAVQAAGSAAAAAGSAADAAAELEKVQAAGNTALQGISDAQTTATRAVEQEGTTQTDAVNAAGQAQQTAIQQAGQAAVGEVQQAQETSVQAVQDAQSTAEEAINALVPDVYTKVECDERYAPIEAAIKVSGKGTGLVSLSPTVAWQPQGMKLYGRSTQDGTPSVETEVPIQNAGQDGEINVEVCGENLMPTAKTSETINGITFDVQADGSIKVSGSFGDYMFADLYIYGQNKDLGEYIHIPKGVKITLEYFGSTSQSRSVFAIFREKTKGALVGQRNINDALAESDLYVYAIFIRATKEWPFVSGGIAKLWSNFPGRTDYQPYQQPRQLVVPTPDGLPGIPVDSGGNWTDENGQQWISDVVDLAAGTKTQNSRVFSTKGHQAEFRAAGSFYNLFIDGAYGYLPDVISSASGITGFCNATVKDTLRSYGVSGFLYLTQSTMERSFGTAENANAWLQSHVLEVQYQITPITTTLDAETVAAYKALQSYPGTTNVLAPDCGIEAAAVAEPNQYIEDKIQAAITQAVAQAVELTGGNI